VDLAVFAVPNIVGEIKRHLRDRSNVIRVPRREQEAEAALGRPRRQLALALTEETSPASADDGFQASEDRVAVSSCLRTLHRRERQVLRCRYFGDMSQTEIAERLGISQTHASRLLASGLAKLRANLDGNSDFAPRSELHSSHGDSRRRQGRAA
jgi:RNA polymerase sigma-B factor